MYFLFVCLGLTEIYGLKFISLVLVLKNFRFPGRVRLKLLMYVTFISPAVTLHTTRFNVQKFYVVLTLHIYVVYGFQEKTVTLSYTTSTDLFCIIKVESFLCAVRAESLNKTDTFRL
jgi:hypothetical protein